MWFNNMTELSEYDFGDAELNRMRDELVFESNRPLSDDELKELPLSEPSAMNDYTGMLIYVHVQLLDGDGTELISETKPVPDPCWNIDDDRLLLCFHIIEHDKEGNTISTDKLLKTKAAELLVAKGKEND